MEETKEWFKDSGTEEKGFVFLQVKWLKSKVFPNTHTHKSLNFPIIFFSWICLYQLTLWTAFVLFCSPNLSIFLCSRYICSSDNFYNFLFLKTFSNHLKLEGKCIFSHNWPNTGGRSDSEIPQWILREAFWKRSKYGALELPDHWIKPQITDTEADCRGVKCCTERVTDKAGLNPSQVTWFAALP